MYCPRCGQQQISEETKFCSRCGFQLGLVGELLLNNGFLPQLAELYRKKSGWLTRKNGLIFSLFWFLFFLFIMTPIFGIADVEEMAAVSAILAIFGGLMLLIASLVFLPKASKAGNLIGMEQPEQHIANLYGQGRQQALPPQRSEPISTYVPPEGSWRAPDTGDLVRPSVTEGTTKLLQKDEER
jgi:hypothetical protein